MMLPVRSDRSGCRVLAYCVMPNHFHILLEAPPFPEGGIFDAELLQRIRAANSETFAGGVAKELRDAREKGIDRWAATRKEMERRRARAWCGRA